MFSSTYFPFFIHVEFFGTDDPKITTPVEKILLGYENNDGVLQRFELSGPRMWNGFTEFLRVFSNSGLRPVAPVGWRLRTLVWPAVVLGCAASGEKLRRDLVMRMDGRWNETRMVDLCTVVGQGSWDHSTYPTIDEVAKFFEIDQEDPLKILVAIHNKYAEVINTL